MAKTQTASDSKTQPGLTAEAVHELFNGWDKAVPPVEELRAYFAEDMVFQDPLQKIVGLVPYHAMNVRLLDETEFIDIQMQEAAQTGNTILFTFQMGLKPSARAPMLHVEGATHVQLNEEGKIALHRDYWDLNSMMADAVPALKRPYAWIQRKMAGG